MQVAEAVHKYARGSAAERAAALRRRADACSRSRALERGAHVVVATPGRALDHMRRNTLKLDRLDMLVLDEADEMLDMGFAEDIDAILEATPSGHARRRCSRRRCRRGSWRLPSVTCASRRAITIARETTAAGKLPRVRQLAYIVRRRAQAGGARRGCSKSRIRTSALVFCRTRLEVDTLVETLNAHGHRARRCTAAWSSGSAIA